MGGLQTLWGYALPGRGSGEQNSGNLFPSMRTGLGPQGADLGDPPPSPAYPASLPTGPPASMPPTAHQPRKKRHTESHSSLPCSPC